MSGYRVQYSAEAVEDIRNIHRYIADELRAPQAARKQVDRIRKMIRSLNDSPFRFTALEWEPWASMGMRRVSVDRYLVFYLVQNAESTVTVIRIFYSGRNIEEIVRDDT